MANLLPKTKQIAILSALVEGNSIRSIARMNDVDKKTIMALLVRVGAGCERLHDSLMHDLNLTRVECDEIWGYVQKKQKHLKADDPAEWGDTWTWVAIDGPTKLIPSYRVGKRSGGDANAFMSDLASRVKSRVQIDTDGLAAYKDAIELAFGADVDHAQVLKEYDADATGPGRYSPPRVASVQKRAVSGNPDLDVASTSYVERQNLTIRMSVRRMTRLTNAFSKKIENHRAATALHFAYYNLCRRHQTLRVTPAMEAKVVPTMWSMEQLLDAALAMECAE